jgi:hypothetical protein
MTESKADRYRAEIVVPELAAKVFEEVRGGEHGPPSNLEDLSLRMRIPQERLKGILHWLIDAGFLRRTMRLPGFRYYRRKRAAQADLFVEGRAEE